MNIKADVDEPVAVAFQSRTHARWARKEMQVVAYAKYSRAMDEDPLLRIATPRATAPRPMGNRFQIAKPPSAGFTMKTRLAARTNGRK
jgi:hypothetical protein